jgi:GWxTD domain-containing protein
MILYEDTMKVGMKVYKLLVILILGLVLIPINQTQLPAKSKSRVKVKDLKPQYRKWITEEVGYIITKWEKKVFLQLETDRERDMFIGAFWKNRDPNPLTGENEYKTEHYRRLKYANENFSKGTPTPGWRTERGRIYISLGEPHSIERYEQESLIYPVIIWFYQGLVKYGLPNAFYVVFFKEDNAGDYELYSPIKHGPHKLLVHYQGDTHDTYKAFVQLQQIQPSVAKVSMTLIEGEPIQGARPSITSEILIKKQIVEAPQKRVNDEYARRLLKYKEYIDIDYSVNFIPNDASIKVIKDRRSGLSFVHYLVEPKKVSLEQYQNSIYGNLEISGSVRDQQGNTVYQFSKNAPIKLSMDQADAVKAKLFSFQDFFPLIEGKYNLDILIRNTVSKEFTSIERQVVVPKITGPGIGSFILANRIKKSPKTSAVEKPFMFDNIQLLVSPRNDFTPDDTLYTFFQAHGLTPPQMETGHIVYTIFKDDKPVRTVKKALNRYTGRFNFLEEFSLAGLPAAYYSIRAAVYGSPDQFLFQGEADFYISPVSQLKRPWVVSVSAPVNSPEYLNIIAIQYANKKDLGKSRYYLERAYNRSPLSAKIALNYCRVLFELKKYEKARTVAMPFLDTKEKNEFLSIMGFASAASGDYVEAVNHFKDYLAYYGTNIKVLNAVGECYHKLGNVEEALVAWERSLELFPDQDKLRTMINNLKKKKTKKNTGTTPKSKDQK